MSARESETEPWGGADVPRGIEVGTEDLDPEVRRIISRVAWEAARDAANRVQIPPRPHVSYQNGRYNVWRDVLVVVAIGISGWTLHTVYQLSEQVAVLQCQLSAACQHAVMKMPGQ